MNWITASEATSQTTSSGCLPVDRKWTRNAGITMLTCRRVSVPMSSLSQG